MKNPNRQQRLRIRLGRKYNDKCIYCDIELDYGTGDFKQDRKIDNLATIDHLIPLGSGGQNRTHNRVPSCSLCNGLKGAGDFIEFYAAIQTQVSMYGRPKTRRMREEWKFKSGYEANPFKE